MINLISTQADSDRVTGPSKVFRNLVKGLDRIGYPYVVNRRLDATKRLWIHDDHMALRHLRSAKGAAVVAGPNLYVLPRDIPEGIDLRGCLYVHPCEWAVEVWRSAGFDACPLAAWPVGIDTDEFAPQAGNQRDGVLVYHKDRSEGSLVEVVGALENAGLRVRVIRYGHYTEPEFMEAVGSARVVVWHGRHESQGIALQETLALDVPIVVMDVSRLSEAVDGYDFGTEYDATRVTAAPYWDERCGVIVRGAAEVPVAVDHVLAERERFSPREFVLETLSLERQAREFAGLWEHFGLAYETGLEEKSRSEKAWREPVSERVGRFMARARGSVARRLRHS